MHGQDGGMAENADFPQGFLWGAATSGHQVEGNNLNADSWLLENVTPTIFREPSLDAANSLALWPQDLDIVRGLGLNSYRFSLEWARIEPEAGRFSVALLDHYKSIIAGCRERGLTPVVTYNHFTTPRWFAASGGWHNPDAPQIFARFCDRATRHLGDGIGCAVTLNEPNIALQLWASLPQVMQAVGMVLPPMLAAAARAIGADRFAPAYLMAKDSARETLPAMIAGHQAARAAIKAVRGDLPVGVSLAIADEQAGDSRRLRDEARAEAYLPWLEAVRGDDFIGVQNYGRNVWDEEGIRPSPPDARLNAHGAEVFAPSLAGAVRYAHSVSRCPVLVTEHGVGTDDDLLRAWLIREALRSLHGAMKEGVTVLGYLHWSLLDNFEWMFGYDVKYGLCSVDRRSFDRSLKGSAAVLGGIAVHNGL